MATPPVTSVLDSGGASGDSKMELERPGEEKKKRWEAKDGGEVGRGVGIGLVGRREEAFGGRGSERFGGRVKKVTHEGSVLRLKT
ncbi:hypothetical protein F0562_000330 [Nyssa sinensis]|uniref:Uncharacterized protein n=1 Tax=Nyssa sinensis TaxID=561372 RepID=A0A5J5C163_9ASTE|nr:hypothetical protein F0562_000330 [Nyssa sinensis]